MSESDFPPPDDFDRYRESGAESPATQARQVLVVDDDEELLAYLDEVLRLAGYRVSLAKNGREALVLMAREVPDVVLLDVMMPELSGDQVLDMLSQIKGHPPVILMTAAGRARDRALAHRNPYYLPKPFDPSLLLATLETALEQSGAIEPGGEGDEAEGPEGSAGPEGSDESEGSEPGGGEPGGGEPGGGEPGEGSPHRHH